MLEIVSTHGVENPGRLASVRWIRCQQPRLATKDY
jgi:hypothetical protein